MGTPLYTTLRAKIFFSDEEKKNKSFKIMWLQSMDDGNVAFPVTDPIYIIED